MDTNFSFRFLCLCFLIAACGNPKDKDYSAYFGGEVINPKDKWILFYQGEKLLDSIPLDDKNRFFIRFDSLAPGLYTFKHEPEYQYVYFDKNDSLMVRINVFNFDESLVFCGRGEEKNNFLIEMYLKNQKDRNKTFSTFDLQPEEFSAKADSSYRQILAFYENNKKDIKWSDDFDIFAKAGADYFYYAKKEFYPMAYKARNHNKEFPPLPEEFYDYRKKIDINNEKLSNYWPYLRYITVLIDNLVSLGNPELDLHKNAFAKLHTTDSLIKNEYLKNKVLNNIVFRYLMEDEQNATNTDVLNKYFEASTDSDKKETIKKMITSIRNIMDGGFPEVKFRTVDRELISSAELFNKKTVVYFWSKKNETHFFAVHEKINKIIERHPDIDFIAIGLDEDFDEWKSFLTKNKSVPHPRIQHYHVFNLAELNDKWVVTQVTRASIVGKNGKAEKAFVNIFETTFEKLLESIPQQ